MTPQPSFPAIRSALVLLITLTGLVSCKQPGSGETTPPPPPEDALARVGSITIYARDLERRVDEHYSGRSDAKTRQAALDDLVRRARFAQAALDAGLADDPIVREEVGRLLEARLREQDLIPRLKEQLKIPEKRLREIYQSEIARFQAPEKRQVAVLWLDSGVDPDKAKRYAEKMQKAREFVLQSTDLVAHPEKGFSVLGADYSEHHASRYRGGVVGWMERGGGLERWTKAVAEIAFTIGRKGDMSEVTTRPEGVFLVRLMDFQPAVTRPFESVSAELEREERTRLRTKLEAEFERHIESSYPVEWTHPRTATAPRQES